MGVTLQFVPYAEIAKLSSLGRIKKLLASVKDDKIVLLEGRLTKEEEAELIKTTMEEINKEFKGVELAVIEPGKAEMHGMNVLKQGLANILLGSQQGLTIVGPANVVKEIKKDPRKIELLTKEVKSRRPKHGSKRR